MSRHRFLWHQDVMKLTPVAGRPVLLLGAYDLAPLGYQVEEFFLGGSASSYAPAGSAAFKTRTGRPPASTPLIALTSAGLRPDAHGIAATGGVRTPGTDVPTMRLSGAGNSGGFLGQIAGIGEPYDKATLGALYPGGKDDYLGRFTIALDRAIAAGHLLSEDRAEILAIAAIHHDKAP
jgi:hypothetical protein